MRGKKASKMSESVISDVSDDLADFKIHSGLVHPLVNNNDVGECETAEEAVTTDSEEYLSESLRWI